MPRRAVDARDGYVIVAGAMRGPGEVSSIQGTPSLDRSVPEFTRPSLLFRTRHADARHCVCSHCTEVRIPSRVHEIENFHSLSRLTVSQSPERVRNFVLCRAREVTIEVISNK